MFFIALGLQDKDKHLGSYNNVVCPSCGRLTRYDIFKSYRYLHIFFIPTFTWNVKCLVKTSCCGSYYELDPEVGKKFEKNPNTEIKNENLRQINIHSTNKYCPHCKTNVPPEFNYCPYCGNKL